MRILVTGGAGYVGGFTTRHLQDQGHHVVALDDLSQGHRAALDAGALVVGDIADLDATRELLTRERIEAVMHFAGSCSVGESVREPALYWRNNVAATLVLLEAMVACDVKRLVFSSSCSVYSENADMPLHEGSVIGPSSPYAATKHAAEQMIRQFAHAHGMRHAILRYFNAAGADPDGTHGEDHAPELHLIPLLIRVALGHAARAEVFGDDYPTPDGTCVRDYVHVADLARAHDAALSDDAEGTYNLGTGTGSSVLEVIRCVERVTGKPIEVHRGPRRPGDSARLVATSDRARRELAWSPQHASLEAIVDTAWSWHRSHPDGYGD